MEFLRRVWEWLKWPVGLALVGYLAWLNWSTLSTLSDRQVNWPLVALAFVLCGGATLITFFRWYLLVWGQNFTFRYRDAVRLGFIGMFVSYILPLGIVGGDVYKAIVLARGQASRRASAVATILLDRVIGLLSLFILGAVVTLFATGLPDNSQTQMVLTLLRGGAVCGLVGVLGMLIPGITEWRLVRQLPRLPFVGHILGDLINGVALYQSRPLVLIVAVGLGLVSHAGLILSFYCGVRAIEPWTLDVTQHFYFMPIAELFATFLPTPGGLGGLEGAISYSYEVLAQGAVSAERARGAGLIGALVFRAVQLSIAAVGGAYYLAARKEIAAATRDAAATQDSPPGELRRGPHAVAPAAAS